MDEIQAITFRLPHDLYENLRREAFVTRRPMNELVVESIAVRYAGKGWPGRQQRLGQSGTEGHRPVSGQRPYTDCGGGTCTNVGGMCDACAEDAW